MTIDITAASLTVDPPLGPDSGGERRAFLVRVGDGIGEAAPLPTWTESASEAAAALERASDLAADRGLPVALHHLDDTPAARAGLVQAMLDRHARAGGRPLYRHLGAKAKLTSVAVNATLGRDDGPSAAVDAVAEGFETIKVKVGGEPADVIDRIGAIREAVGDDIALRVDANGAWSAAEASTVLSGVSPIDLEYVEQPCDGFDVDDYAALAAHDVPIALDEGCAGARIADLERASIDVAVIKPMATGGLDRARALALTLRNRGITPVISNLLTGPIGRHGEAHLVGAIDPTVAAGLATADRVTASYNGDEMALIDGRIALSQGAGLSTVGVSQ